MKHIKYCLLLFLLIIPFSIKADHINYSLAAKLANEYIVGGDYLSGYLGVDTFKDYDRFLIFPDSKMYYFDESNIRDDNNEKFTKGGLLSSQEFLITYIDGVSYLATGNEYWTLSPGEKENTNFSISYNLHELSKKTDTAGLRVTEFVEPRIRIKGKGEYYDPWVFIDTNLLTLKSNDEKKGGISSKIDGDCSNVLKEVTKGIYLNEEIKVNFCPTKGYQYFTTECEAKVTPIVGSNSVVISEINNDLECNVKFIIEANTITLDENGGSEYKPDYIYVVRGKAWYIDNEHRINEEASLKLDSLPTKKGYEFNGFYTDKKYGYEIFTKDGKIKNINDSFFSGNKTIYARYNANTYNVEFDKDGGKGGSNSAKVTFGKRNTRISTPNKDGYNFDGYWTSKNGSGNKYYNSDGSSTKEWDIDSNTKLYAKWTPKTIRFDFDKKGGINGDSYKDNIFGENMKDVTPPTKTGYNFDGYYTAANGTGDKYYDSYGNGIRLCDKFSNTKLYANWIPKEYTIYLNNEGGNGKSYIDVQYNQPIDSVTPPTKTGQKFDGYYTQPYGKGNRYHDSKGKISRNYKLDDDLYLYANWKKTCNYTEYAWKLVMGTKPEDLCAASSEILLCDNIYKVQDPRTYGWYCANIWEGCKGSPLMGYKYVCGHEKKSVEVNYNELCPDDIYNCIP